MDKQSSLFRKFVTYGRKKFCNIGPRSTNVILTTLWQSKRVLKNHAGLQTSEQMENSLKDLFKHPQVSPLLIGQKFGDGDDDDDRSVRFNLGEYSCNGKTNIRPESNICRSLPCTMELCNVLHSRGFKPCITNFCNDKRTGFPNGIGYDHWKVIKCRPRAQCYKTFLRT